jgi:hypothetical protein
LITSTVAIMRRLLRAVVVMAVIITSALGVGVAELRAGVRAVDRAGAGALGEAAGARRDRLGRAGRRQGRVDHGLLRPAGGPPEVRGFLWFNHDKEADWRVQSSDASRIAYAAGVAASRYV